MAKKNRTGLQSEISHIFAGVPMPKRRRSRSDLPEKKPKSKEPEQTQEEKPLIEESPIQKEQEKQPVQPEISEEKTPVAESLNEESSVPEISMEQEQAKETPVENLIAPQSQVEEIPIGQPPVVEPPVEQPSAPFDQAIEIPELEEPIGTIQELPSVRPVKRSVTEPSVVKAPRKARVSTKGKSITSKPGVKSRKQKIQIIFIIALSILLVYLLVNQFSKTSSNTRSVNNNPILSQISPGTDIESVAIDWEKPPVYPAAIRNPMLPDSEQRSYTGTPIITGISYGEEERVAIIKGTGKLVKEGEEIFGWKVKEIKPNSVVFEKDGKTMEIEPQGK